MVPIHRHPELLEQCCDLINSEWPRSTVARMRSLETSSDNLPTCLILTRDGNKLVIAHLKLSPITGKNKSCFVESVVVAREHRGKGLGSLLMIHAENFCKHVLQLTSVYISTKGQEAFYAKLGYTLCQPISHYGGARNFDRPFVSSSKTYMTKHI